MNKRIRVTTGLLCMAVLSSFSLPVFAAECSGVNTSIIECSEGGIGAIWHILNLVLNILSGGIGIVALIGILVFGVQYLTAGGDVGKAKKAESRLYNITIGLIAYAVIWTGLQWLLPGGIIQGFGDVNSIDIKFDSDNLEVGETVKPIVTVDGDEKSYSLKSSDESIAGAYASGTVHCKTEGHVTITAIAVDGKKKSAEIDCVPRSDDGGSGGGGSAGPGGNEHYESKHEIIKGDDVGDVSGIAGYVLDVPEGATDGMPLIVYLAGDGEKYSGVSINSLKPVQYIMNGYSGSTPYISIAPYLDYGLAWKQGDVKKLIEKIVKEYKIDTNRIYGIGLSSGATRLWNLVNDNPNLFSAIVPVSNYPQFGESPSNFKHTKVHGAVGEYEYANGWGNVLAEMQSFAQRIKNAGGSAEIDVYPGQNHGTITKALKTGELVDWMLDQ